MIVNNNVSIWSKNTAGYDAYRPQAPTVLLDMLTQLIQEPNPGLVVDIGCGTGLSTFLWTERAQQVIGIEPNDDMRRQAEASSIGLDAKNIEFRAGLSTRTGLPDDCASIVTCSQSLHWMEPEPTFADRRGAVGRMSAVDMRDYCRPHMLIQATLASNLAVSFYQ